MPEYKELACSTALHRLKRKVPYGIDLNIYRGCEHGCKYCYAVDSHSYLNADNFFGEVYVKTNVAERLEQELSLPGWTREVVNIGGVTDSYQPAEAEFSLMPDVLKLLIKYKTPAIISTKSALVLRDYDLIDELSRITYVNVAATITTMDEAGREKLEPNTAPSKERFDMLKAFRKTNASVGLHVMPIVPYITDSHENFEAICASAKDANVHYLLPGTLYLRGQSRKNFFGAIREHFPEKYEALAALYQRGGAGREYKDGLYQMVNGLRGKYGISRSYSASMKEKMHTD